MSSGNNNMFFGSNIDGSGNFQSNGEGFFHEGVGGGGGGPNGEMGNHQIVGVDEHMRDRFYLPYPYIPPPPPPLSQLEFPPPSFPHPIPVISWGSDNHMYPGGHQQPNGSNQNGAPPNQRMTVGGSNNEWWSDAPMPPNEEDVYNRQSSSSQESGNPSPMNTKNEPTTPRTPFAPQNEASALMNLHPVTEQQQAPYTPNPADIRNLERLNLNQAPVEVAPPPSQDDATNERDEEPRGSDETALVVVRCPLDVKPQGEILDLQEDRTWISVQYFAGIENMMATFLTTSQSFTIDSSNETTENHCGLEIFDKVIPDQNVITCRNQIGGGLRITKLEDGTVWLTILTNCSVFVISPFKNMVSRVDAFTICRYKRARIVDENFQEQEADEISFKIFDDEIYRREMNNLLSEENGIKRAARILPALCCTRVSFVKGFGGEYPRQAITQCPCWVEIKLVKQMADLDALCRQDSQNEVCGSRS